jgi:hypothetical protein
MSPGKCEPVILPTWISALAYGQAMAIKMFSGIHASIKECCCEEVIVLANEVRAG